MILAIDSSAIVALVRREATANWLTPHWRDASERLITAANAVEVAMVLESGGGVASGLEVLTELGVVLVPVDAPLAAGAVAAWRQFGKGRHPAGLDYADCFSYSLAASRGIPLLCVGDDFQHTDLDVLAP